ncbi:hypothetical protein WG66_012701, partial [Moniliophthora roreri]
MTPLCNITYQFNFRRFISFSRTGTAQRTRELSQRAKAGNQIPTILRDSREYRSRHNSVVR